MVRRTGLWRWLMVYLVWMPFLSASEALFFDALRRRDQAQIRQLLARDPALIRARANDGRGPLHHAVTYRGAPLVHQLLELGADADAVDRRGDSVLHALVRFWPDADTAARLMKAGADPNRRDRTGNSPLFLQMRLNQRAPELTEALLVRGADPNLGTHDGWSPLHFAMQHAMAEATALLLQHGADPNHTNRAGLRPIHMFGPRGPTGGVDLREDYLAALAALLKHGADAKVAGVFRGSYAGHAYDRRRLHLLLDHGAVVKNAAGQGTIGLHDLDTVDLLDDLLNRGAVREERNEAGQNRLGAALARAEAPALVRFLINRGFDGAARDAAGNNSPHHLAAAPYDSDAAVTLAKELLAAGTPAHQTNKAGENALQAAVRGGRDHLVQPILAASGNAFTPNDLTDLLAEARGLVAATVLIDAGASPHGRPGVHPSPLQAALTNARVAVAQHLMAEGAALDPPELAALQRQPLPILFRAAATMARAGDPYLLERRSAVVTAAKQPFDVNLSEVIADEVGLAPLILIPFWLEKLRVADPDWRYHAVQQLEAYSGDTFGSVPQIPLAEGALRRWHEWYESVLPQLEHLEPNLFGDLGLTVDLSFTIETVQAKGPAERAGLKTGWQVLTVNGRDTRRMSPGEFDNYHRRGAVGSQVTLTIVDQNKKQRDISLERALLSDETSQNP
ncbi:ankyrin repeat domain-containing protein [Acanthopleuribacter pedis]|uniref:Ankyrin repeat domain-containing protein n=1 Tax=Acanthopleuribacter pedis TaxID=442870 RepID=A0A8J7QGM5_9BACT|nr:ankyrin repeat domain-containing protein [Acanthopleuribacter pedis]MBO1321945.1 ankyrin repeat domain-containing protein [Acanthopleuribacter pedis]